MRDCTIDLWWGKSVSKISSAYESFLSGELNNAQKIREEVSGLTADCITTLTKQENIWLVANIPVEKITECMINSLEKEITQSGLKTDLNWYQEFRKNTTRYYVNDLRKMWVPDHKIVEAIMWLEEYLEIHFLKPQDILEHCHLEKVIH